VAGAYRKHKIKKKVRLSFRVNSGLGDHVKMTFIYLV